MHIILRVAKLEVKVSNDGITFIECVLDFTRATLKVSNSKELGTSLKIKRNGETNW